LSQNPDTTWLADIPEFRVKRYRDLKIDPDTYQTSVPKIFMAGDYREGPSTIIAAVADGRSAAQQVARFLDPIASAVNVPEYHEIVTLRRSSTPDNTGQIAGEGELARVYHNMSVDYDRIPRQEMPKLAKKERRGPVPRGEPGLRAGAGDRGVGSLPQVQLQHRDHRRALHHLWRLCRCLPDGRHSHGRHVRRRR
jgi:hypothetical protein